MRWMERPWDSWEGAETPAHHTGIVSRSQALGQICARLWGRHSWRWRGDMGPPINPNHGSPWAVALILPWDKQEQQHSVQMDSLLLSRAGFMPPAHLESLGQQLH